MYEFKMPALGAEMEHGTLLEWKVAVGDKVKRHDIIAVIDTDKAAIDIESFGEGVVEKLIAAPGDIIPVGEVIALIQDGGAEIVSTPVETKPAASILSISQGNLSADKPPKVDALRDREDTAASIKISPLARKLAHELNIDISSIKGSGPNHVIIEDDIRKAAQPGLSKEDHTESMKKVIGAAMAKSKREIPHYYLSNEMDLKKALDWLEKYNLERPVTERMVYAAMLIKAVSHALKTCPEFNGFYTDNRFEASESIHIGMAISLRGGGLITPAILNVDKLSLTETMSHLTDLVIRTRAGKLKSAELSDSTITVTNLGELGVDSVFGVIYPPQVALVGFGKIRANKTMIASLAADHRVTNGLIGSRFLSAIANLLQEPELL